MTLRTRLGTVLRRGSRPLLEPHQARLDHHDVAIRDITTALQQLQAWVPQDIGDRLRVHDDVVREVEEVMPQLLNTITSAHGQQRAAARQIADLQQGRTYQQAEIDDLRRQTGELWDRLEKARAELLYELRYQTDQRSGAAPTAESASTELQPTVVDPARVAASKAAGNLRLNLGCGHRPLDDYVNVDMRALPGVDVVATVDHLPFDANELDEIYSAHVVEHFPQEQLTRRLLPYWFSLIRPGGEFRSVVPDAGAMLSGYAAGEIDYETLREITFGGQEYEGDFHFNSYTTDSLTKLLLDAGFVDAEIEAAGRPNGNCLEFQIVARKPE